jgi:hypothetical protein
MLAVRPILLDAFHDFPRNSESLAGLLPAPAFLLKYNDAFFIPEDFLYRVYR